MKHVVLMAVTAAVVCAAVVVVVARAQEQPALSEEHQTRIRANCLSTKETLRRIHISDASLRVNRGQAFENISTRLIAPFNSRMALNRLDGTTLSSITAAYEQDSSRFGGQQQTYQRYEQQLSQTLEIDCTTRPTEFYYAVAESRRLRSEVHDTVKQAIQQLKNYRREVDIVKASLPEPGQ